MPVQPKIFPYETLYLVARDSSTDLSCNGNTQPGPAEATGGKNSNEIVVV
jgi:hypothetical protein